MNRYPAGMPVVLQEQITVNGSLHDPTGISVIVEDPRGTETTYTLAGSQVTRISQGVYKLNVATQAYLNNGLDEVWTYHWDFTDTIEIASIEGQFAVYTSIVPAPAPVTVTVPPGPQDVDVDLVLGDDYLAADGRGLAWQSGDGWPVLTGATITLRIHGLPTGTPVTKTGTVVSATVDPKRVSVDVSHTDLPSAGVFPYELTATLTDTHVASLATGNIKVTSY